MKRLIILIAFLTFGLMSFAQTYSYSTSTVNDASGTFWNYADTLTDAESIAWIVRVKSPSCMDLMFQVVFDEISGASTTTGTVFGSNDGTTYLALSDSSNVTITAPLTADGSMWINVNDFNYSYVKLILTQAGTATCRVKGYYSFRKE